MVSGGDDNKRDMMPEHGCLWIYDTNAFTPAGLEYPARDAPRI
jgi:hypothetical protein